MPYSCQRSVRFETENRTVAALEEEGEAAFPVPISFAKWNAIDWMLVCQWLLLTLPAGLLVALVTLQWTGQGQDAQAVVHRWSLVPCSVEIIVREGEHLVDCSVAQSLSFALVTASQIDAHESSPFQFPAEAGRKDSQAALVTAYGRHLM